METITIIRLQEAERLIRWVMKNPGKWNRVIDKGDMNTSKQFVELLKELKEAEFYQIIFVLLYLNEVDDERHLCGRGIEKAKYEMIAQAWNDETIIKLTDKIIDMIKKEEFINKNEEELK